MYFPTERECEEAGSLQPGTPTELSQLLGSVGGERFRIEGVGYICAGLRAGVVGCYKDLELFGFQGQGD